jgi:hypothetical protein
VDHFCGGIMRKLLLAVVGLTLATTWSAFGDNVTFDLTTDEFGDTTPYPSEFVQVSVTLDSDNQATVVFTGEDGYDFGKVFFNVNGDYTLGAISNPSNATQTFSSATGNSLDSYGVFSEEVNANGGPDPTEIQVVINAAGTNTWTSAYQVLNAATCPSDGSQPSCVGGYGVTNPDGGGGYNAGHYPQGFDAAAYNGTGTDLAGYETPTPEPSSLLLMAATGAVLGLAAFARKRFSTSHS